METSKQHVLRELQQFHNQSSEDKEGIKVLRSSPGTSTVLIFGGFFYFKFFVIVSPYTVCFVIICHTPVDGEVKLDAHEEL